MSETLGEVTLRKTCDNDVKWIPVPLAEAIIASFRERVRTLNIIGEQNALLGYANWLEGWREQMADNDRDDECGWSGEVEVSVLDSGVGVWTCPRCDERHEIDFSDEADDAALAKWERDHDR